MTKNIPMRQDERGVALLITMLSVMLLSVIALGMMVSTNTETTITANFRDKQTATFAAMAGLQEARDRIQPTTHNISAPADVPSLTAANVIYIINPKLGETIAPWDMTNKYKDTELCHEGVLGLSGTANMPCTMMVPTSNTIWRTVVDNSLTSSFPWNLATPLDVKWTRITLKTNNTTPIAVDGNGLSATQVCWDGYSQIPLPAGYASNCAPDGGIVCVGTSPCNFHLGSGYTSMPTVTLSAPPSGGIQATANAGSTTVSSGIVQSAAVTAGGSSYTSKPTVTLSGGGGTGATATATIQASGAPVTSVSLTSAGAQCYANAPAVSISGGGGSGAAADSTLAGTKSCIDHWTPKGSCKALKPKGTITISSITLSDGNGSGFNGSITFEDGAVTTYSIQDPGAGYTSKAMTISIPGYDCGGLTAKASVGYLVQSVSLTTGGSSYTSAPVITIGTGTGTGAVPSATAALGVQPANSGQVTSINITSAGSGYISAPTVAFSGGGGSGAAGTTSLGGTFQITCCTITNPGKGYTTDPTVTITGGGGSGATATAAINRRTHLGAVYVLTSLAKTANGSRTMMQMEVASPVLGGWVPTGALTFAGPYAPGSTWPNGDSFMIDGHDDNKCFETAEPDRPAIASYDDPNNPTTPSSVVSIVHDLPKSADHYIGSGGTPSVVDVFGNLGDTLGTPTGLKALIDSVHAKATSYTSSPASIDLGSFSSPAINYVDGDLALDSIDGYGVLVVTGRLSFSGDFKWHGVVLVVGDGIIDFSGGGSGQMRGTMLVAKIWDNHTSQKLLASNGVPTMHWNGGGGNGIIYDHCWATNLMNLIPFVPPPTTQALKVLSVRQLPY